MRRFIYLILVLCFYSEFSFAVSCYSGTSSAYAACSAAYGSSWPGVYPVFDIFPNSTSVRFSCSTDSAGHVGYVQCGSLSCPEGQELIAQGFGCAVPCSSNQTRDLKTGQCVNNPSDTNENNNICSAYSGTTFNYTITLPKNEILSPPSSVTQNGCTATFGSSGDDVMNCIDNPDGTTSTCYANATYTGEPAPSQESGDPAPDSGAECGVEGKPACPSDAPPLPYTCTVTNGAYSCTPNPDYTPPSTGGSENPDPSDNSGGGSSGGGSSGGGSSGGSGDGTGSGEGSGTGDGTGSGNGEGENTEQLSGCIGDECVYTPHFVSDDDSPVSYGDVFNQLYLGILESPIATAVGDISFPSGGVCPIQTISLFNTDIVFDAHCDLWAQIEPILSLVMLAAWAFLAIRVLLSA
ncbi:hypothetical protein LX59_01580 [Azomonas agilis]|uniref:TspB protein n=1 Tax=Azomonas agilis TaxID=116849 RepID=A0A562IJU8_9GAMM|nr:hypothetical protein [Azomonas agilis]TWH71297.1 hypothetical protein LX59_01580 [Azomonas agilis]